MPYGGMPGALVAIIKREMPELTADEAHELAKKMLTAVEKAEAAESGSEWRPGSDPLTAPE